MLNVTQILADLFDDFLDHSKDTEFNSFFVFILILYYTGVRPVGQDLKKILLLDGLCSKKNCSEPKFKIVLLDGLFPHKSYFSDFFENFMYPFFCNDYSAS